MTPTVKNSSIRISIQQTTARQTPKTDFGSKSRQRSTFYLRRGSRT